MQRFLSPTRRRRLSEADQRVWESYVQLVAPLAGAVPAKPPAPPPPEPAPLPVPEPRPAAPARRALPAPLEIGTAPGGVDRATWSRFRGGKLVPQRTLDLHGRTVARAHAELLGFLARAAAEQLRCVEIVTGRGSGENGGAIRREFPHWVNQPPLRTLILAASHPHPANQGAVRLLLRRAR